MPMLLVGNLLLFSFYGGVVGILLPIQVQNIDAPRRRRRGPVHRIDPARHLVLGALLVVAAVLMTTLAILPVKGVR